MDLGKRLRERRKELKLSVEEVARRAAVGVSTLYDLERGTQQGSTKLHKIVAVLGMHIEYAESGKGPRLLSDSGHVHQEARQTYYGLYSLGIEAARIGWEFQKLLDIDPGAGKMLGEMIELFVAAKTRSQRSVSRKQAEEQAQRAT